jgi:hypothetical protein
MKRSSEGWTYAGFMKTIIFILIFCSLGLFSRTALACSCVTLPTTETDPVKIRESARHYYLEQFHGALFTGKVLQSEVEEKMIDFFKPIRFRKVVVEVEKFWLGIDTPKVTLFTGADGGECGVDFEVGKEYFFAPSHHDGTLTVGSCNYANGLDLQADEKTVSKMEAILGKGKTFPKPKN